MQTEMDSFLAGVKSGTTSTLTLPSGVIVKTNSKKTPTKGEFMKARQDLKKLIKNKTLGGQSGGMCLECG